MGNVVVSRSGASFRNEVEMGKHSLVADEPASAGGGDEGPTPYDLLAAALATCKSMTLHFYAKREDYPLSGAEVRVTHQRAHAKDCADCLSKSGYIHQFRVEIRLEGDLAEAQREKLLEIAGRCPVAKTLNNEIRITDHLVDEFGAVDSESAQ